MHKSNIIAGSNIYAFFSKNPEYDEAYVKQVHDVERLKYIKDRGHYDTRVAHLSDIQKKRTKSIDRCTYAKNDPCWGYSLKSESVISVCINGKCKHILECNPSYSEEYAKEWQVDKQEHLKYGNPDCDNLKRCYYVDLESDEEMRQYMSDPQYDGLVYASTEPNKKTGIKRKTRMDPETGKMQIVVGYEWTMIGGYDTEECKEIWAYVEDEISRANNLIVKAPIIEPLEAHPLMEEKPNSSRMSNDHKQKVVERIKAELKNGEAIQFLENNNEVAFICDNPAERGFISKMLTDYRIYHGYQGTAQIQVVCKDTIAAIGDKKRAILTANVLNGDNSDSLLWTSLSVIDELYSLKATNREFKSMEVHNRIVHACANNYALTHICIELEDFENLEIESNGVYELILSLRENRYVALCEDEPVGYTSESLIKTMEQLYVMGEIPGIPESIEGIQLCQNEGTKHVQGIGHMNFVEY